MGYDFTHKDLLMYLWQMSSYPQHQLNTSMNLTGLEKSLKSSVRMTEGQHLGTSLGQ